MGIFLKINGINVPILDASSDRNRAVIGADERSVGTTILQDRRAIKLELELRTPLLPRPEALALEGLIEGAGNTWTFDNSVYSQKGVPPFTTSSGITIETAPAPAPSPKFGGRGLQVAAAGAFRFTGRHNGLWTLIYWRYVAGAWAQYVETSTGGKWANGVASGHTSAFSTVSSVAGQITLGSGPSMALDDVTFCPYQWPATWPAQAFAESAPWGPSPFLRVTGDAVEYTLQALGRVDKVVSQVAMSGGAPLEHRSISFTLREN